MELPDEAITFNYQGLLVPPSEEWTAAAELRARHFITPARLRDLAPRLQQCRSQIAADREIRTPPPDGGPLEPGFIDLPQQTLDAYRRKGDASELGRTLTLASNLRDQADRVVFLAAGGCHLAARAVSEALLRAHHNDLPPESRLGVPRIYFEGQGSDNDSLQDLLDVLQITCVDPDRREERWAVVLLSKTGSAIEPLVAHRVFRREAAEYYGLRSPWLGRLFACVTGTTGRVRDLFRGLGHGDDTILPIPDNVGPRFAAFTPAGLLPAAIMGLDVRALLLGAAAMTKRFLEEPFERNPVLQFAAVNHLMAEEGGKSLRLLAVWSRKLEGVGHWYEKLASESLGKQGRGPTPFTLVQTRDLHAHGQQLQEGPRDRVVLNLVVRTPRGVPVQIQMADHNDDDLNVFARRTVPDITSSAHRGVSQAAFDVARPSADLVVPTLSEHTVGQLLQLLMLATVVEARLMGVNPYGRPGAEALRKGLQGALRGLNEAGTSAQGAAIRPS